MTASAPASAKPSSPPAGVRLFVMDVDGTLTDGTLLYGPDGGEWKAFHARDGMAVQLLHLSGIVPAVVTGRSSELVDRRAKELGIRDVVQGAKDKAAEVRALRTRHGVAAGAVAYIGDDLSDLPPMREAGFSAAPADAAPEVRRAATYVASVGGGRGALRDAVEFLLRREGRWDEVMAACVTGPSTAAAARGEPVARSGSAS